MKPIYLNNKNKNKESCDNILEYNFLSLSLKKCNLMIMWMLIIVPILMFSIVSCTKLDEQVYSTMTYDNFFKTEAQVLSAAGPAYSTLKAYVDPNYTWGANELSTDEMLLPHRGVDWFNGGIYERFHTNTWLSSDFIVNNAWYANYLGITYCNNTIYQYKAIKEQTSALVSVSNELKGLRAFYYFNILDLFGNAPLVDSFNTPKNYEPKMNTRQELFNFVSQELITAIPLLNPAHDMTTYGRFHKWAAFALQAKLYLNAVTYTGTPMWDECIAACDSIINSGKFTLTPDNFSNFARNNVSSTENIFVIPFDDSQAPNYNTLVMSMFQLCYWTLHFNGGWKFNIQAGCWNGICGVPSFYRSYDSTDIRRTAWLVGLQFLATGDTARCIREKAGQPLIYTVDVTSLDGAAENEGARIAKYDYRGEMNTQMANDFVVFRLADVLLMKAEALMRKNGGVATQDAVDLVNQLRSRAFNKNPNKMYTTTTLTLDALLAERGWELCSEGWRRNDMIRFGVFKNTRGFKTLATDDNHNVFPIPQPQLNANPNLVQNPGY